MKQGSGKNTMAGGKVEPKANAMSVARASQLGIQTAFNKPPLQEGRGFEAPKDSGRTVHPKGSQGRR